jgi:hypothetical protein
MTRRTQQAKRDQFLPQDPRGMDSRGKDRSPKRPERAGTNRTAGDIKLLRGARPHFTQEELAAIPILPTGARLEAKDSYLDLRRPEQGEFDADGSELVEEREFVVARSRVAPALWRKLLRVDWLLNPQQKPMAKERPSTKSKSMKGGDGERKLASGHGRAKRKTGGEPQKNRPVPQGATRRAGSSKR